MVWGLARRIWVYGFRKGGLVKVCLVVGFRVYLSGLGYLGLQLG